MPRKKTKQNKKSTKSKAGKKPSKRKGASRRKNTSRSKQRTASRPRAARRGRASTARQAQIHQGVALKGGQSGDVQGLSTVEDVDSESVTELAEEGQAFEAGIVDAVENAPDADQGDIKTEEVPEDDVSPEYRGYRETDI